MAIQAPETMVRQYKSRRLYEVDAKFHASRGWAVQHVTTTTSRRMIGCLFGLIGYWILPKLTVYHVTYTKLPPPPAPPPPPPGV